MLSGRVGPLVVVRPAAIAIALLVSGAGCADWKNGAALPDVVGPPPPLRACPTGNPAGEFAVTLIRSETPTHAGNRWTAMADAFDRGYRYIEIDVRLTADGELVPTRYDDLAATSTCTGSIRESQLADLAACEYAGGSGATLRSMREGLAGLVFDGIYLDLKYTIDIQPDEIERTVEAISRLRDAVPNPNVIVAMSYDAATVVALSEAGLRAGWKGYPTIEAAEGFVDEGVALGAEMVCIQSISVDATVLDRSAELGIWHLPWESPANIDDALIVRLLDGFAGGLITDIPVAVDSLLADHCGP